MFTFSRLSKKTFFAAAALGAAVLPAHAWTSIDGVNTWVESGRVEVDVVGSGTYEYGIANTYVYNTITGALTNGYADFIKTGSGDLLTYVGTDGSSLYGLHIKRYNTSTGAGPADYVVHRYVVSGTVINDTRNYIPCFDDDLSTHNAKSSEAMMDWTSGELRIEGGILELLGFANVWFDFGTLFNEYYKVGDGTMHGASRVTIMNGAVLDLSGNVSTSQQVISGTTDVGWLTSGDYPTVVQFLHNLRAGDYGADSSSELRLGSSPSLHVALHVDAWDETAQTSNGSGGVFDDTLAFGGSIGVLNGAASVYKTGDGTFTILNTSAGFTGDLYAAGGSLVLAGSNTAGYNAYEFTDTDGNVQWKAQISSSVANANSVNIAGTYGQDGANGESRQGSAIKGSVTYASYTQQGIPNTNPAEEYVHYEIKESYFVTPSAGTLVIAENQQIKNFQSYFNAGYAVVSGTSAEKAVSLAGAIETSTSSSMITSDSILATAPIIAGTGTGSTLVIPGGNYTRTESGDYELNVDESGYMQGGVLLITQEAGMGGVYTGSIVGCRVSIYDVTAFDEDTANVTGRKEEVRLSEDEIKGRVGLTDDEMDALDYDPDTGSFDLDNAVAWKVVDYYKSATTEGQVYYIDYTADETVTGGVVVLDGAGDLALLLETSNFSGLQLAATRTGKTVVNISALNALPGSTVVLGGTLALVPTQKDTLTTKLSVAEGADIVFTTADTISTVVRTANSSGGWSTDTPGGNTILVGDVRKTVVAFAEIQDLIEGDIYVERGVDLDLSGQESVFPNASSLTLWAGSELASEETASSSLSLKGSSSDDLESYNQVVNNLTGDSTARIDLGSGVLTVNITENEADGYSGLTHGTYAGIIRGEGSVVKGGSETFTLSGGSGNIFTGTMEVGEGTLAVSAANGISNASALILNAGTTVQMTGDQTVRNLFGSSSASLTVTDGTLTLGANSKASNGDNRPLVSNNLGTSDSLVSGTYENDNSFSRFDGGFDLEGNRISVDLSADVSQAEATNAYLTATAKLAYSGFDASALEQFVGVKDYTGEVVFSESDYSAWLSDAKNGTLPTDEAEGEKNQLSVLADKYAELTQAKYFSDNITATSTSNGYYSPRAVLLSTFSSESAYQQYVYGDEFKGIVEKYYGGELPPNPTTAEKAEINQALYQAICQVYEERTDEAAYDSLKASCSTADATLAKFATDFGGVTNLGGTALLDDAYQSEINLAVGAYGAALEQYSALQTQIAAETDPEKKAALQEEADELYARIYTTTEEDAEAENYCLFDQIAILYGELSDAKDAIENKQLFAGIAIPGAFANSVTVDGTLIDADGWVGDLAFAGTIETASLVKTGDNTVKLTGSLKNLGRLVINAGTLDLGDGVLSESEVAEGISVARGASLSVAASGEDKTFDYAVSGAGNFVKTGSGKLTLGANVLYTGTTTVRGGTLQMSLRESLFAEDGTFVAEQDNVYLAAEGVSVIFDQSADVEWNGSVLARDGDDGALVSGVSVGKIGAGTLTILGDAELGDDASVSVSEGALIFSGSLFVGADSVLSIDEGATLSVSALESEQNGTESSLVLRGLGLFQVSAGTGAVTLNGSGMTDVSVETNGAGMTLDAFLGTASVSSGALVLTGESVFDYARGITIAGSAASRDTVLRIGTADSQTTQTVKALSGVSSSKIEIAAGSVLNLKNDEGTRLGMDYSTGYYAFDESDLIDAPNFAGTISGAGTISVSGRGLARFTGNVSSAIEVRDGGQLLLNASSYAVDGSVRGLSVTVGGKTTVSADATGKIIVGDYSAATPLSSVGNVSSGIVVSESEKFYDGSGNGYLPAAFTASYTNAAGEEVAVDSANVVVDETTGKLIDAGSGREVSIVVTAWYCVEDGELSANWAVLDKDGNAVDPSTAGAIVWDETAQAFVLGEGYEAGHRWLATDGNGNYTLADTSKVSSETLASEVLISVNPNETVSLDSDSSPLTFDDGGVFGKVGDGELQVLASDFSDADRINVYEGELHLFGGQWFDTKKTTAAVADGATLTIELDVDAAPDFNSVYGSGTLRLTTMEGVTAAAKSTLVITGVEGDQNLKILPTDNSAGDGKFFNGKILFDGYFDVTLRGVEICAVGTSEDASLSLEDGVTFVQTQNSEIKGGKDDTPGLTISGEVNIVGTSADAGRANSRDGRRMTVNGITYAPSDDAVLTAKNIGFGFNADQDVEVVIDRTSVANSFYVRLVNSDVDGNLVSEGSQIGFVTDIKGNANPDGDDATSELSELSIVKSGEYSWTLDAGRISEELGAGTDEILGISSAIYNALADKDDAVLNIGTEEGTFTLTGIGDFTGMTANGVSVNLLTLRSTVAATAGTIEVASGEPTASAEKSLAFFADAADEASGMQELSQSILGTGNVEFSGSAGTLVTAEQKYTGDTTVSGLAEFSGEGRKSRSARITVADGGELRGGVQMQARSVSYSGTAVRNMNEMGSAGSTTLKLTISDSRLPKDIVLQLDVGTDGQVEAGSAAVLSSASLTELGLSVGNVEISDGNLEIEITDSAYEGGSETYTVSIDMDEITLPTTVGASPSLSGSTTIAGTFVAEAGGSVVLDATAGDLISAGAVVLESGSSLTIENIGDASVLGKNLSIIEATTIGNGTDSYAYSAETKADRSEIVAKALRNGDVSADTPIMVFTDDSGTINAKRIISDFSALGVDYDDGIDGSFLDAISRIASADDGNFEITEGVLNADALQDASGADVFNLFFALNSISSDALADEVSKLSPIGYASMLAMPVSVFNSDIARLRGRLDQRRYDAANPLRESGEYEFFVYAQSDFAENGSGRDSPVFDYNLYGATAGYDWKPNYETTLGVAVGYTYGKAKIRNSGGNVKMDDMRVTAFASRLFGNFYLDVGAQLGFADFDAHRNTIAGPADGDTHALLAGGFATFGAAFSLWQDKKDGSGLYFTPNVGLSYMHADISDFSESGTAGLDVDDADGDSLRLRVAAGLQWVFPCAEWEMRLGLEAAYAHEFLGEELDIDGRFSNWNNSAFSVSGKALSTDTFSIGPTADLRLSDHDSLYCGYGIEFGTDSSISQNVSIGYRRRF